MCWPLTTAVTNTSDIEFAMEDMSKWQIINERPLNVRRYSKDKFRCEQDWVAIATEAGPWC